MTSASTFRGRSLAVLGGTAIAPLTLAGRSTGGSTPTASASITVGTIDKITSFDPAGSYDNGAFAVMNQIYPFPLNSKPGSSDVQPDTAESAKFNELVQFKEFPDYKGMLGAPKTPTVDLDYYTDQSNRKLDVQKGESMLRRGASPQSTSPISRRTRP